MHMETAQPLTPPTGLTIRPFNNSDQDYANYVALSNTVYARYPTTVAARQREDEKREPKYKFGRFVAEQDGVYVAHATYSQMKWAYDPHRFTLSVAVDPDHRRQGIGAALYRHLLQKIAPFAPTKLKSWTFEDEPDAIHFLARRGFAQQMRFPCSRLKVASFDPEPFAWAAARASADGIRLTTLAAWGDTEAHFRQMYDFDVMMTHDIPTPDPITPVPFEKWAEWRDEPNYAPDQAFLALDGETIVGMSILAPALAQKERLYQWLTGTHRDYRRRGIATALKVMGIRMAQRKGYTEILTDNEENNPMYQINLKLGFQSQPAELSFAKELV